MTFYSAGPQDEGIRIDTFLSRRMEDTSRNAVQKLISGGFVTCDGEDIKKNHVVSPGQGFQVILPPAAVSEIVPQRIPLDIVWEDGDVIVVNKPRGMVVHPAPGHPDNTLVNALMAHCGESLSGIGGERRPGIVHRLDKDTSGLIVVAKNDTAHRALAAQLKGHGIFRAYEAVAWGRISWDRRTVNVPIGRHGADRKRMAAHPKGRARNAVTHGEVVARYSGYTHIRCVLETGRTHQIRVHMAHIGHPLLGDPVYGRRSPEKGLAGQCLHAKELAFTHPGTGLPLRLETALPDYFTDVLLRLGPKEP